MANRFYNPENGTYSGPWPSTELPQQPKLDLVTYLFAGKAGQPEYADIECLTDADTDESLTHAQLHEKVKLIASGLSSLVGVKKGDVVAIILSNTVYYPVIFLAITSLGAIVTPMNPISSGPEIEAQVGLSGAKFGFVAAKIVEKVKHLDMKLIICGESEGSCYKDASAGTKFTSFSDLVQAADLSDLPAPRILQSDTAALLFSSGTTGISKGVIFTHKMFIAFIGGVMSVVEGGGNILSHRQVVLMPIPMFHVFGLTTVIAGLMATSRSIIMTTFDFAKMLKAIQKYRVTIVPVVPPILIALAKQSSVQNYDLSSVKCFGCGGASVPKDIIDSCKARFPQIVFAQGYGMTETTGGICSSMGTGEKTHPQGSVGYLVRNVQGRILDVDTGVNLPPDRQGELLLRGPQIMKGYWNDTAATAATVDEDGWLHTGDLAYFDSNGNLFIVDRIKELIKYKGYQVAPAELETVLLKHAGVADAVVIPVPDEVAGELPVAWVVRTANSSVTEVEIMDFVAKEVAPYKKVRKVLFTDAIPKGDTGKTLRKALSARAVEALQPNVGS